MCSSDPGHSLHWRRTFLTPSCVRSRHWGQRLAARCALVGWCLQVFLAISAVCAPASQAMQSKSKEFISADAAEKAFERMYSIGKSRAVPRGEIEALLSESGIDLSCDSISTLLADATHEDGTVRIDTDKSNILLRVCACIVGAWGCGGGGCEGGGGGAVELMGACVVGARVCWIGGVAAAVTGPPWDPHPAMDRPRPWRD